MKKKTFQKKNLCLDTDEDSVQAGSVYSEIGPDGLRFLKENIKVSKDGLQVQGQQQLQPINADYIQIVNKHLGRGAAGTVSEAIYKPLGIRVAIKSINAYDREKRYQLMNDIKILLQNKMNAENNSGYYCQFLVNLYGAYFDEGSVKVVLELMDAGSLGDILRIYRAAQINGPIISEPILAKISQQILNGLSYLHLISNQIHRDIKPDNILLNSQGYVKLTDFGISRDLEQSAFCTTNCGTQAYMSPERIGAKKYNHLSDIWSFGIVLYELAMGKYPFSSAKTYFEMLDAVVNEAQPELSGNQFSIELKDFLTRCLQKKISMRASAIELLSHPWILQNFNKGEAISDWLQHVKHNILPIAQKNRENQDQKLRQQLEKD
ncbi:unnamed protein product [Paramecium sonneborni]|uniref:Protein kinase domain-containing protein n=1 Tax=Paramecium sonneborni TaxID=65129 RepID=A0A8S1Q257_9CILI|nr:unnamed protein product [Paramecium sonneborni]